MVIYSTDLAQESLEAFSLFALGFSILFGAIGFIKKRLPLLAASFIFFGLFLFKSLSFIAHLGDKPVLLARYETESDILTLEYSNDGKSEKQTTFRLSNLHDLALENLTKKVRGGLSPVSGAQYHYSAITYRDAHRQQKELVTTRTSFGDRFMSTAQLQELLESIKSIDAPGQAE